jgi:vacuolar-type H+-ATPase subunit F/Vma7
VAKTLVENKNYSELKNISMLSQVKNSNLSQQFNNAISKITEQLGSTTNVQQILNTINTELNNLNINQNLSENTIVNQNSDFINQIYNSVKNNSQEENKNYVNNLKQQFLNETLSTAENIISNQNIKIENISNVLKTLNINNFNSSNVNQLKNIIQENVIANNYEINENNQLNYFSNYLNNLAFKVDLIENSTNINNFDEINILAKETALKYTTEFSEVKNEIKVLNTFRNEIQNVNNYNDLNEVINNFQTNIKQLKLEQIDFVANTLIDNSEYKRFIKENKELLTFTNLQETLTTNSVFLNNEVKQVLNNVLESNDSLQSVVNNFANITQQNISSVYQNSSNNTNFSDMNVFEKNNIITELNNIYSEEVIKQRFENYETKTFSSLLETVNLINLNNNLSVQQKIDNIVSSISFMSSAKESILEYLLKNFNVFNMERTYNSLTKNLIEEVELNIQNYNIQKNVSEALNNNIYINQNILNSQIIENASNVIKNTLKTEILNENFESIFNQQNNNELVNDLAKVLTSTSNYSLLNTVVLESVENEINQVISQKISNNNDQNYSQLSVLNYTNDSKNINLPDNISKINTTNTTQQTFENTTSSFEVINNEEDVDVSNLRIDKIWNNFVKTEVDKIVEEINSDGEINNVNNVDQRTFNNTSSNINSTSSNIVNNSYESNVNQDLSSTKNESNYYSLNDSSIVAPNTSKIIRETETTITEVERINILQITETVFEKIEQKLKSYNVTQEDIVILKQKIIFEVTEYYERRTSDEIRKTEKRVKDDIQDMFIKFLNT